MTFNIRGGNNPEDKINMWSNRAALNVGAIQKVDPDIFGLQECQYENLAVYSSSLTSYDSHLGHNIDSGTFNPIFWRSSHFDFVEGGQFWLSPTPDIAIPSKAWNASSPRTASWVKLSIKGKDQILLVVNTHWDHMSEEARRKSAFLVSQKALELRQDAQLPIVLLGDFNCSRWRPRDDSRSGTPPSNEPYYYLIAQGFIDCFLTVGNSDSLSSNTFHGFMGEYYEPWRHHMLWRADWILSLDSLSSISIESCFVVRDAKPPLYPSDHYPVVTDFKVN